MESLLIYGLWVSLCPSSSEVVRVVVSPKIHFSNSWLLPSGSTVFTREYEGEETKASIAGECLFEPCTLILRHTLYGFRLLHIDSPACNWDRFSPSAKDFVRYCLNVEPMQRPTAEEALRHPWLKMANHIAAMPTDTLWGQLVYPD